jgi:hypothetical protein
MATTAWADGHRVLYHWQRFNPKRLQSTLETNRIYCSSPGAFNDPWDCKPHFNSEILADPQENERHVGWAVDLCRRKTTMSPQDVDHMRHTLLSDRARAAELLNRMSEEMGPAINEQYRVYCLGPSVSNLLMWAHYAESHNGVCLEFNLANETLCGALRCSYLPEFPLLKLHDDSDDAALLILLSKSEVWSYEQEYRLVAQERAVATSDADTLMTDNSFLQLPSGALRAVITGCQSDHDSIRTMVQQAAPGVRVRRAVKVPNRFELSIED